MASNKRVGRATASLVSIFVNEAFPNGQEEDLEVEQIGPVTDVIEVAKDALVERGVSAPAVDLRPASDARLHAMAKHVVRDLVAELVDEYRTLRARPHQRHVPGEHVPELRELIEAGRAQQRADRCAPIVASLRP